MAAFRDQRRIDARLPAVGDILALAAGPPAWQRYLVRLALKWTVAVLVVASAL